MKNLLFGVLATIIFTMSSFAVTNSKSKVITDKSVTFNSAVGICHIEITYTDSRGNTNTDVWDLPCNTAAQCKQMLADTLAAY